MHIKGHPIIYQNVQLVGNILLSEDYIDKNISKKRMS